MSPEEAYTSKRLSINYIKVFGSIVYLYISPKSMLTKTINKKLLDPRVKYMFVRFSNKTIKQLYVYRLDLRYTIISSVIKIDKNK